VPVNPTPRDRELAEAAQRGDGNAFGELVGLFAARLCAFFRMIGVPESEAEDLAQDTFIRAHRNLHRYDARYAFSTWLFTIGRRLAISRARARRPTVALDDPAAIEAPAAPASTGGEAGGRVWERAAALLPARQYEALWLRYGEDKSLAEVSAIMGVSGLNARVLLHRARSRLAQALRNEAPRPTGGAPREGIV
jgi:RNA polymerase sigma-70 factor, ECF subfamily